MSTSVRVRRREERVLFGRMAHQGDSAARDELVQRFLPLARKLARGFRGGQETDDLEQVAAIGLVKAIDRFDFERGLAFSTFAVPTILGELKRHLRDHDWSIRVPRDLQELSVRLERVSVELISELGRSPTVAELAERAGSSSERVLEALAAGGARYASSLDQPRSEADDADATGRDVAIQEDGFAAVEDAAEIDQLMSVLSHRDRRILDLRFREDRLQWEIAEVMGMSQMHVSRVIRAAIEELRAAADRPAPRRR